MDLLEVFKDSEDDVNFPAGSVITEEGADGNHMFVVMDGELVISMNEQVLATARSGEIVGEMPLIDSNIRSANVKAMTDCRLVLIDKAGFESLLQHVPGFSLHMIKVLADRLKHAYEVIGY